VGPAHGDHPSMMTGLVRAACTLSFVAGAAFAVYAFGDTPLMVDEYVHYPQIVGFARKYSRIDPRLTMIPGYHAIIAALSWVFGGLSIRAVRAYSFLVAFGAIAAFYFAARADAEERPVVRTLQLAFLPIALPLFFLIYTDATSLLFVLWMMLAAIRNRPWQAGMLGLVACLIRQNNIVWVAFAALWMHAVESGWSWSTLREELGRYWAFVLTAALFIVFVWMNGGVALGDAGAHPLSRAHLGNVFFLLFLCPLLLAPMFLARWRQWLAPLHHARAWLWLGIVFVIFWTGFSVDHPYNLMQRDLFLRNAVLGFFISSDSSRLLFFVPIGFAILGLRTVELRPAWWLIYPFTVLFLLPSWLIEQRYYLIPLSLLLLAREPISPRVERLQVAWFAAMSGALFLAIERDWTFM